MKVLRGYPVKIWRLELGGRPIELLGPDNYETLLDDPRVRARFDADEFMPYWANLWPGAILLAEEVAQWPRVADGAAAPGEAAASAAPTPRHMGATPAGAIGAAESAASGVTPPRVLELGCGLGLVGLVACGLGYRVIVSDYEDDALTFVLQSAAHNRIPPPEVRFIDWRERYPDLRLDRIVAADVLYETRHLSPIARFIEHHLAPDGFALICDANRSVANDFETIARHCNLHVECTPRSRPAINGIGLPDTQGKPIEGRIFRITHR